MNFDLKKVVPHIIAIVVFLIIATMYFLPQLSGKTLPQNDILQFKGMASEALEYRENGENILWTNSMFSGMPTFQISTQHNSNFSKYFEKTSRLFFKGPIGIFLSGMLVFYIAMILLGVNTWLAIIGSVLYAFTPNNLVLFEAGHSTKVRVLLLSILVVAGFIKIIKKSYLPGGLLMALGLSMSLYANHYQMTYYLAIVLGIFALISGIDMIVQKEYNHLGKTILTALLAIVLAVGTSASNLFTTNQFVKETMRGGQVLEKDNSSSAKTKSSKGLDWDYANQWSNGTIDLVGIFIPGAAGGGSNEPLSKSGPTNKYMKKNRMNTLPYGPMYWGKLPFTSGPAYLGAITIFFFIFSLFFVSNKIRWWAISAVVLTLLISMGKNAEWINRLLFENLPMFSKFRAPSSITGVTAIVVAVTTMLGLNKLFTLKQEEIKSKKIFKYLLTVTGILAGVCLFYAFIGPSFFDFSYAGDARYAGTPDLVNAFEKERAAIMRRDSLRTLFFVLGAAAILYFFLKQKLSSLLSIVLLAFLILIDIMGVDVRYVSHSDFVKKKNATALLEKRAVDKQILMDNDIHYRVHDVSAPQGPFNSASASLFHKTVGGYNAAKLRRYQDMIDRYIGKGIPHILNMLNTKYVIMGKSGAEEVKQNPGAYGNAWFVNDYRYVESNRAELDALENLDPKKTAIIHSEFKSILDENLKKASSGSGSIKLKSYHPDKLVYESNNSESSLAIFSETWYGPDLGWNLYIDGKKSSLLRANYILRAAVIPAGTHEIIMKFEPKVFKYGSIVSLISSIVLIAGIGLYIFMGFRQKKEGLPE